MDRARVSINGATYLMNISPRRYINRDGRLIPERTNEEEEFVPAHMGVTLRTMIVDFYNDNLGGRNKFVCFDRAWNVLHEQEFLATEVTENIDENGERTFVLPRINYQIEAAQA